MMANNQSSSFDRPPQVFRGIRFVLLGFDSTTKAQLLRKLVDGGGVDAGQYGPNCTHVIVDKLAYDDPMCVAARRDGKILVSGIWVDHSFDVGVPVDTTSVMYRPVKDLTGIPGAQSLVICLTGYQRQDREDIMTMVALMGGRFSKPLIANKVTHLICHKFEGEKYLLAKKMKIIKLINHRWLEDCLKAWEILPEADYSKSGYELEMEAEAKDSEDEAEGLAARHYEGKTSSPHHSLAVKQEVSESLLNTSASKGRMSSPRHYLVSKQEFSGNVLNTSAFKGSDNAENTSATIKSTSNQFSYPQDTKKLTDSTCEPSNLFDGTSSGSATGNNVAATAKIGKRSPLNEAKKVISASYSRKVTTPPTIGMTSNLSVTKRPDKLKLSDAFDSPFTFEEKANDGTEEEKSGLFSGKRKMEISGGSSKLQRTGQKERTPNRGSPYVQSAFQESKDFPGEVSHIPYLDDQVALNPVRSPVFNISATKPSSSKDKSITREMSILNTLAPEVVQGGDEDTVQVPPKETKVDSGGFGVIRPLDVSQKLQNEVQGVDKLSPATLTSDLEKSNTFNNAESSSKPVKKKSIGKKILASYRSESKTKISNQKGSIYLRNSESKNDIGGSMVEVENDDLQIKTMSANKSLCMDDETELPEDKEEADKEKQPDVEPEKTVDIVMEEKAEVDQRNDKDEDITKHGNLETSLMDEVMVDKADENENLVNDEPSRGKKLASTKKVTKKPVLSAKEGTGKKAAGKKELAVVKNTQKPLSKKESTQRRATKTKTDENIKEFENSLEVVCPEGVLDNAELNNDEKDEVEVAKSADTENLVHQNVTKIKKRPESKTKKDTVLSAKEATKRKAVSKRGTESDKTNNDKLAKKGKSTSSPAVKGSDLENSMEAQKENRQTPINKSASKLPEKITPKSDPMWFILSGHKLQRREFQQIIKRLKGRICRVSHQWSYQATHFIAPDPIRRTEKFFAAAASGRWILKTDYLSASNEAGKFVAEEPYEWHKNGLSEDGQINLEAPRKWRLLKQKTGHGAFYGMQIIIYGECIAPPLDTLKRVVKAGDGTILATSPPYTRFLGTDIDFAIVSPGMPRVDMWVQEFLRHEIPCVSADYLVEYVCKPGYPLEKHIQYDTNAWAERSFNNLMSRLEEDMNERCGSCDRGEEMLASGDESGWTGCGVHRDCCHRPLARTPDSNDIECEVCGSRDRGEEMLICGDESGSTGCGIGMHIDCCDPPLADVPEEDWFCNNCKKPNRKSSTSTGKKSSKRKGK